MVGDQDLVAGGERDGVEGDGDAFGDVGEQGEPFGVAAEGGGDLGAGPGDPVGGVVQEGVRVAFLCGAQFGLPALDGDRDGAVRAVVEVGGTRVEGEQGGAARERGGRADGVSWVLRGVHSAALFDAVRRAALRLDAV